MSGDWHQEDGSADVMDEEGNYYRGDLGDDLPETVSRGAAGQRLDMQHGFLRHIVRSALVFAVALTPRCQLRKYHGVIRSNTSREEDRRMNRLTLPVASSNDTSRRWTGLRLSLPYCQSGQPG